MSLELALAHVGIRGDTSQVVPDIQAAAPEILQAVQNLSNNINTILSGIGIGFGFSKLLGLAHESIAEAEKAAAAEKKLGIALSGVGNVAGFTMEQMSGLAEVMSGEIGLDTAEIKNSMAALVTYGIKTEDEFKRILVASHEISSFWGGDMFHTTQSIAQALANPAKGMDRLSKQGFKMTDEQRKLAKELMKTGQVAKAQAIIWEVLSGQENKNKTISPIQKMQLEMGNLKEAVGKSLLPIKEGMMGIQVEVLKLSLFFVELGGRIVKAGLAFNTHFDGLPAKVAIVTGAIMALGAAIRSQIARTTISLLFSGWGVAVVAIGAIIGAIVAFIIKVREIAGVQAKWGESVRLIKQAFMNLWTAVSKMFQQIGAAVDAMLGGPFARFMEWLGIAKDGGEGFAAGMLEAFTNMVLNVTEWLTVLAEHWRLVWDVMSALAVKWFTALTNNWSVAWDILWRVVKVSVRAIWDVMMNLGEFISQAIGYGLNKAFFAFIGFLEKLVTALGEFGPVLYEWAKNIPEMIRRGMMGEDINDMFMEQMMQPMKNIMALGKGLMGEAPKVEDLWKLSGETKKQFGELGEAVKKPMDAAKKDLMEAGKALDPLYKHKKDLEKMRQKDFGTVLDIKMPEKAKEGGKQAMPEPPELMPAVLKSGRYGFADFGKQFQDQLLKKDDDKAQQTVDQLKLGNEKQDQVIKQFEELNGKIDGVGALQ